MFTSSLWTKMNSACVFLLVQATEHILPLPFQFSIKTIARKFVTDTAVYTMQF